MDGVLTGVYSKLQDGQVPLRERIELCSRVLSSNNYFLPNKRQILSDWLCNELHHLRNLQASKDGVGFLEVRKDQTEIWQLLLEILKSANGENISFRQRFLAVLFGELTTLREYFERFGDFEELARENFTISAVRVFTFCKELLQNTQITLVLFNRLDNIEQCLREVLKCFLALLYHSSLNASLMEEMCKLVNIVLQKYVTIQQQQITQRKVFSSLCDKLLHLLLLVKYKISNTSPLSDCAMTESSKADIVTKIDSVVATGLYHKDHLMSYKSSFDNTKSKQPPTKKPKVSSYTDQLFEILRSSKAEEGNNLANDLSADWDKSATSSLPFLFESFLKSARDEIKVDRTVKFNFFTELYSIISQKDTDRGISEVDRMIVVDQMLGVLLHYDVYQIAEDNANNLSVFKWLLMLTNSILDSHLEDNAVVFRCLNTLLSLNHKILESVFESVLERCLVKSSGGSQEETEKMLFFCNLIDTYSKLQQVENLIKCMLKVIKTSTGTLGVIPVCILTKLSQAFEQCPLNLTIVLYRLFLDEMKGLVESLQSMQEEYISEVVLKVIVNLFVTFLTNSSYNATDQHGVDTKRASLLTALIEDTKVLILIPLFKAFPSCKTNRKTEVGFSALYLLYGLSEVIGYLKCHNIITNHDSSLPQVSWSTELGTFIPDQSWDHAKVLAKKSSLKFCTEILVAQKVRNLIACETPDIEGIRSCMHFLYGLKSFSVLPKTSSITWNGDPCSVTSQNYEVAHWCLVAKHAPLFIQYCDNQVNAFAKCFVRTLVQYDKTPENLSFTVGQVSSKLLQGGELHAQPSLQTAIVKEFWEIVGKSVDKVAQSRFPKLANIFTWSSVEEEPTESCEVVKEVDSESEEMEVVNLHKNEVNYKNDGQHMRDIHKASTLAQDLADLMKDNVDRTSEDLQEGNIETDHNLQEIENLLNVLKILPCSSFTPANQVHCLLGLLACDVVVATCVNCSMHTSLQLTCRHTLVTLLQEWLQHCDFTAWRLIDMESLLTWLSSTMLTQDQTFCGKMSDAQTSLAEVSKNLLQVAITLAVKSRKKASLTAICDFNVQLLSAISDKIKPKIGKNLELVYLVVLACTELLEQKLLNKSSVTMVSSVIKGSVVVLVDPITQFLKDKLSYIKNTKHREKLESLVLKLVGVLTKAIGFTSRPSESTKEGVTEDHLENWGQVLALVFAEVIDKLGKVESSAAPAQIIPYVIVLGDISQCTKEHRKLLPDAFQAKVFQLGLEFLSPSSVGHDGSSSDGSAGECGVLDGAILHLFSTLLEVNDGENCVSLLESLVSLPKDDPPENLLTRLTVFKMLLSKKVVKKRKKDLRAKFGKILVAVLCHGTNHADVLTLVLEIIASVLNLGNGALFPQDLALVFQSLAIARGRKLAKAQAFLRFFTARFQILSLSLFYYHDYVYGVIHLFLTCVNDLLSSLLTANSKEIPQVLPSCAQKMSRLYQEFGSHKDVFRKYATYFLADCVHLLSTQGIPGLIRETMVEGVHYLLDISEDDTLTKVHMYLPSADRELLRSLQEDFNKHHKFKGNA